MVLRVELVNLESPLSIGDLCDEVGERLQGLIDLGNIKADEIKVGALDE